MGREASAAGWLRAKECLALAFTADTHVLYGVRVGTKKFSLVACVGDGIEVFCGFG